MVVMGVMPFMESSILCDCITIAILSGQCQETVEDTTDSSVHRSRRRFSGTLVGIASI